MGGDPTEFRDRFSNNDTKDNSHDNLVTVIHGKGPYTQHKGGTLEGYALYKRETSGT